MNDEYLFTAIRDHDLYFKDTFSAAGMVGDVSFDIVAESHDGMYKIIHRAQVSLDRNTLEDDKFSIRYQ